MQPELFEHFAAYSHNCFLNNCSITLIYKRNGQGSTKREEHCIKVLKTVALCGLSTLNWWLLLHAFLYIFPRQDSSLRKIYTPRSYVFCKEFGVCILGCWIILFDGDSNRVETNQTISIASWLFGFCEMWDFSWGNFWTFCNTHCCSLVLSKLLNCI